MQEINETLPATDDYTETCGINECLVCGITKPVSECKICQATICNDCRPDHSFGPEHYDLLGYH